MRNQQRTAQPLVYTIAGAVAASDGALSRSRIYLLIKRGVLRSRKEGRRRLLLGPGYRRYLAKGAGT